MKIALVVVWFFATLACSMRREGGTHSEGPAAIKPGENKLGVGSRVVTVELAKTIDERRLGLMFRNALDHDSGMLFIYPTARPLRFWMQNTLIPLSIAFLGEDGRIINIEEMQAMTETTHRSAEPCRFALEMASHWFEQSGVKAGDRIAIPAHILKMEAEHD